MWKFSDRCAPKGVNVESERCRETFEVNVAPFYKYICKDRALTSNVCPSWRGSRLRTTPWLNSCSALVLGSTKRTSQSTREIFKLWSHDSAYIPSRLYLVAVLSSLERRTSDPQRRWKRGVIMITPEVEASTLSRQIRIESPYHDSLWVPQTFFNFKPFVTSFSHIWQTNKYYTKLSVTPEYSKRLEDQWPMCKKKTIKMTSNFDLKISI